MKVSTLLPILALTLPALSVTVGNGGNSGGSGNNGGGNEGNGGGNNGGGNNGGGNSGGNSGGNGGNGSGGSGSTSTILSSTSSTRPTIILTTTLPTSTTNSPTTIIIPTTTITVSTGIPSGTVCPSAAYGVLIAKLYSEDPLTEANLDRIYVGGTEDQTPFTPFQFGSDGNYYGSNCEARGFYLASTSLPLVVSGTPTATISATFYDQTAFASQTITFPPACGTPTVTITATHPVTTAP